MLLLVVFLYVMGTVLMGVDETLLKFVHSLSRSRPVVGATFYLVAVLLWFLFAFFIGVRWCTVKLTK